MREPARFCAQQVLTGLLLRVYLPSLLAFCADSQHSKDKREAP
jgi:hypothetical protein